MLTKQPLHHSLPKFVTLNGADTFFVMLETNNDPSKKGNNVIRMCLTCSTHADAHFVEHKLKSSSIVHWLCNIQLINSKRLFFKPKWKYVDERKNIVIHSHDANVEDEIPVEVLNRPLIIANNEFISCDRILYPSGKVVIVLSWHHALMDGRGSGFFIRSLLKEEDNVGFAFPEPEREPGFYHYVRNMYKVKRFIQHSSRFPIGAVRKWNDSDSNRVAESKLYSHTFSPEQTKKIDERALESGAKFGSTNFLLACCAIAVHRLRREKGVNGDLWIPVPYDGRKRGGLGPIISNQIAFLFYRLSDENLDSVNDCTRLIHEQMMHQLKMDIPKKYDLLLRMMRYIPIWLYRYLTTNSSEGRVASFLFSSAGQDKWDLSNLTSSNIEKIQLIPPATVPPGLTFNFLRNNNCLTLNLLWSTAVLDQSEMEELKEVLLQLLAGE